MREIQTKNGYTIFVDDEDYDLVSKYSWKAKLNTRKTNRYAARRPEVKGKKQWQFMHRLIMGLEKSDKRQIDHIDGNGLNNIRSNLRIVTNQQNSRNSKKYKSDTSSKYKGVHYGSVCKKYKSSIKCSNIDYFLGRYTSELEAGAAYDIAAYILFGEYAKYNFEDSKDQIKNFIYLNQFITYTILDKDLKTINAKGLREFARNYAEVYGLIKSLI